MSGNNICPLMSDVVAHAALIARAHEAARQLELEPSLGDDLAGARRIASIIAEKTKMEES